MIEISPMRYNRSFPAMELPPLGIDDDVRTQAAKDGVALVDLRGKPLSNQEYIEFMSQFGMPLPEEDSSIQEFVEDTVILNIRTKFEECLDSNHQPFATNGLTFHMERAFTSLDRQPNYLSLLCLEPPDESAGGQTLAYPMDLFREHFSEQELELMRQAVPRSDTLKVASKNPLLAFDPKRNLEYFALRDLGEYGKEWTVEPPHLEGIESLMRKVRERLYDHSCIRSLKWEPGYLYILDNKRVFHARTEQQRVTRRHLKRIRVL